MCPRTVRLGLYDSLVLTDRQTGASEASRMTRARLLHPANVALALVGLAFIAWEIVAALFDRGTLSVMVTLSEYVWWLRDTAPVVGYPAIVGFCSWLLFHFLFGGGQLRALVAGAVLGLIFWLAVAR